MVHPGRHPMTVDRLGATPAPAASRSTSTAPTTRTAPTTAARSLDDDFLILVNGWWEPLDFAVPETRPGQTWTPTVDTYEPAGLSLSGPVTAGDHVPVRPRSLIVLQG